MKKIALLLDDPEALANAYKRLASNPELISQLLAGAQKRIAECFTWDGIIDRQIAVYNRYHSHSRS